MNIESIAVETQQSYETGRTEVISVCVSKSLVDVM